MIDAAITAAGNGAIALPAIYLSWRCVARAKYVNNHWAVMALHGMALVMASIALRIGMWNFAIWFRPDGQTYHPWMFVVRDELTVLAAAMFVVGCSLAVGGLAREPHWRSGFIVGGLWAAAGAIASGLFASIDWSG